MKNGLRPITGLALDGEFNCVLQFQNVIKHVFEHKTLSLTVKPGIN